MAEHHQPAQVEPADPDTDPEAAAALAAARARRPLRPGDERVDERLEWVTVDTLVDDVKGIPHGVTRRRMPMYSARVRRRSPEHEGGRRDG